MCRLKMRFFLVRCDSHESFNLVMRTKENHEVTEKGEKNGEASEETPRVEVSSFRCFSSARNPVSATF